jgi:phosphoglycerate dehydrogenase-like enzyme
LLNGLYVMRPDSFDDVYGPDERAAIERHLRIGAPPMAAGQLTPELLADLEVLVTAWQGPQLTAELLDAAPKLQLVLYGAGSIKGIVTPESWARGVRITTANTAIAHAVAEFALAEILISLKHGWRYIIRSRAEGTWQKRGNELGANGATVGLVSFGATGQATAKLLSRFDLNLLAYDPYVDPAVAEAHGVRLVGLDELIARSDVVSLHVPNLPATRHMVSTAFLEAMKRGATLINTSRGAVVDENALVEVLSRRADLFAVLDVTDPEPPAAGSPLFSLPNIVVTPHIAGSLGKERRRQGRLMAEELARYVAGEPMQHEVFESAMARSA